PVLPCPPLVPSIHMKALADAGRAVKRISTGWSKTLVPFHKWIAAGQVHHAPGHSRERGNLCFRCVRPNGDPRFRGAEPGAWAISNGQCQVTTVIRSLARVTPV